MSGGESVARKRQRGKMEHAASVCTPFTMKEHFAAMGVEAKDYVVVKQGYLWPGAAELAASQTFCMTPGTATNDFSTRKEQCVK